MKEQLISLWESNFGDERTYIERFLETYKDRMKIPVFCENEKVISSCYLLPAFMSTENGTEKPVWYLYALSTHTEEKGKGYAGRLLNQISEDYFLVPVEGLETFYEKRGLKRWLTEESHEVTAKVCSDVAISIVLAEEILSEYEAKRNKAFEGEGYVRWDQEALQYALKEHESCGGKILCIRQRDEVIFVLLTLKENSDVIYIKEITAQKSKWAEFAALAAGFLKAEKAIIPGKTVMVSKNLKVKNGQGYFGLTLG